MNLNHEVAAIAANQTINGCSAPPTWLNGSECRQARSETTTPPPKILGLGQLKLANFCVSDVKTSRTSYLILRIRSHKKESCDWSKLL
jgi:hypothetical protein